MWTSRLKSCITAEKENDQLTCIQQSQAFSFSGGIQYSYCLHYPLLQPKIAWNSCSSTGKTIGPPI